NDAPTALSWGFAEDHSPLPDAVREARDESIVAGVAPVSAGVAATLRVLAATTQARAVVEIGTDLGASALSFLSGMASDGILTSIDPEPQNQNAARRLITQAGYPSSRFRL